MISWEKVYRWYELLKSYYDEDYEDYDFDERNGNVLTEMVFESQGWHIEYATPAEQIAEQISELESPEIS